MIRSTFIISILSLNIISAQNTSYKFDYYDISNGLSQNRAQVIFQASDGYIYVGSQGGLDRFDGYSFNYYSHNPSDSTTVPFGWVSAIGEDSQKNLWVGTTQKTLGYLKPDGSWERIRLKGMEQWDRDGRSWWWGFISDIKFVNDEIFISSNGNGLFVIKNGVEKHYTSDKKEENVISEIKIVNNRVFVATQGGMLELDTISGSFKKTAISSPVFGFSKIVDLNKFYQDLLFL